ncbi:hypothetical protein LZK98_17495 [Sphingomonas cannabina]|uniref:hypothetical protein n=1 Tax=Sphingomonas cannabina TaxID=2899123 RepID=UPI001F2131C9|nr:hypothetical protein [Sphingomonas cannabina]UIJ44828.1 hypothetical protein LZK98_17495 [Sphingomonas cannabina]
MRRPIISDESPWSVKVLMFVLLTPVLLAFVALKLVLIPFERPVKRTPDEVARYLRDFLNGTGGPWDWDDFISIPIADPRLEDLRRRAANLDLPMAGAETAPLQALVAEAEMIADAGVTAA